MNYKIWTENEEDCIEVQADSMEKAIEMWFEHTSNDDRWAEFVTNNVNVRVKCGLDPVRSYRIVPKVVFGWQPIAPYC